MSLQGFGNHGNMDEHLIEEGMSEISLICLLLEQLSQVQTEFSQKKVFISS